MFELKHSTLQLQKRRILKMNIKDLIGHQIKDILVWSKLELGGLDEAEVFIKLENGKTIGIPWDFDTKDIEQKIRKGARSLFVNLADIPVYEINPEGKTIAEVLAAKEKRANSFFGRIKKVFGIKEGIPKEYRIHKTSYVENKTKYLQNQKIVDFLVFENSDSVGFLELENGYLISETTMAPHGTGMAGLNFYENLQKFESNCGTDYKRLMDD